MQENGPTERQPLPAGKPSTSDRLKALLAEWGPLFLVVWFGLFGIPSLTGGYDPVWKPRALLLHQTLFWLLVALLVVHVGAALWHHFRQRDEVLRRMVAGPRKQSGEVR